MNKEIEVKIELTKKEFNSLVKNFTNPDLEKTYGYFKDDFSNIKEGIFPRIKTITGENNKILFAVKRKVEDNDNFFEREELEVTVQEEKESVEMLRLMLKSLGFTKEIIFEKKRKNIVKKDIVISYDHLPFGYFVEFEGAPKIIEQYLKEYKLTKKPRITKAYLALWYDYKEKNNISKDNCEFN